MRRSVWLAVGLLSSQAHGPAAAAGSVSGARVLDEVIVTAQRREEKAQSVPIAITTLAEGQLAERQVGDVAALRYFAPNLDIAPGQGNSRTAAIAMRGQVEISNVPTVDSAVGLFLDGSYIARATGANLNLVDIERVEILRGPQGTLFGRNTIGGAINIVPNKPAKRLGGYVELLAGNYDRFAFTGVLNAPVLGERGAVRVAAHHTEHSGFARTVVLDRDLSDDDTDFIRAQFRLSPEDDWDLNLSFDYSNTSANNQWITMLTAEAPATLLPAASGRPEDSLENYRDPVARLTHASHAGPYDSRVRGASATFTYPSATNTLKAIVAARDLDVLILETDLDGTPYDIATQLRHEQAEHQVSYEVQSFGHGFDGRLDWVGGAYYFDERVRRYGLANQLAPLSMIETNTSGNVRNSSRSAYLQLAAHLSPRLRAQAGARHVRDTRELTSFNSRWSRGTEICTLDPAIRDSPEACRATLPPRNFDYVPLNLSIDYSSREELMLYAKYGRGQRAGGYNFRVTDSLAALPFEPETVDVFEIGVKSDGLGGNLRLNAALFRTNYDDIQLTQVVLDNTQRPVVVNVNGGSARIEGGELEVGANLGRVGLTLGLGHIDASYTRIDPDVIDVTLDSEFRNTPAWTVSAAVEVPFRFRSAAGSLHADYSWRDDVFYGEHPLARQDDFHIVNVRFSTGFIASAVELSVWCKNVADRRYISRALATGTGLVRALPADPRTFGATVAYRFGAHPRGGSDVRSDTEEKFVTPP